MVNAPFAGDGIGYPVEYDGQRITIDVAFLRKCKLLGNPLSGANRLNETTVIKSGEAVRMAEAAAMRLVAEKTSIPVPRALDAYVQEHDGRGVIIIVYIVGETLDKPWPSYNQEQKDAIIAQLRSYLDELRSVRGDGISVSAVDGSPCNDQFFETDDATESGPFATEAEFHEGIAAALRARGEVDGWCPTVSRFLASLTGHKCVLNHGDLAPRNVLVRDDKIVAIIDWELASFYPDYWEYIKCFLYADWGSAGITEGIPDRILTPRLAELAYLLHARDIVSRWLPRFPTDRSSTYTDVPCLHWWLITSAPSSRHTAGHLPSLDTRSTR